MDGFDMVWLDIEQYGKIGSDRKRAYSKSNLPAPLPSLHLPPAQMLILGLFARKHVKTFRKEEGSENI
jgi:hypothetical protein